VTGEGKFAAEIFIKTDRLASWCQCHQMNRQISRLGKASSFPTVKVVRKKSPMSQVYKKKDTLKIFNDYMPPRSSGVFRSSIPTFSTFVLVAFGL